MNAQALARALRVYTLTHPGEANTTVKQFAEWFLVHPYFAHGSSKVPCEACGMSWEEHQQQSIAHSYCECVEGFPDRLGRCTRCSKPVLP